MSVWRCKVSYLIQRDQGGDALDALPKPDGIVLESEEAEYVCDDKTWERVLSSRQAARENWLHRHLAQEALRLVEDARQHSKDPGAGREAEMLARRVLEACIP